MCSWQSKTGTAEQKHRQLAGLLQLNEQDIGLIIYTPFAGELIDFDYL
jgi:hypothetical protein